MIVLIKGKLETLGCFIDGMAENREDVVILDVYNQGDTVDRIMSSNEEITAISFNNIGTLSPIWEEKGAKVYNFIVDHPSLYINDIIRAEYKDYNVICIDKGQIDFLKMVFPHMNERLHFLPHGGRRYTESVEKTIDVFYAGGFLSEDTIEFAPIDINWIDSEDFYNYVVDYFEVNEYIEPHKVVLDYVSERCHEIKANELVTLTRTVVFTVAAFHTQYKRRRLVEELIRAGVTVHLCGDKWVEMAQKYPSNVVFYGQVSPEKCIELIAKSKVVLNISPYYPRGSHERIFNGMLNKSVVVTNRSTYLESRFEDGVDIIYWDEIDYEGIIGQIIEVINDEELRSNIVENAFKKVSETDQWTNRLDSIISGNFL